MTENTIALRDLIALDPPSAGTNASGNPLARADVIFARFGDGSQCIIYGTYLLKAIVETGKPKLSAVLVVLVEDHELETLCAMVHVLRGHHDYVGATTH
jgi:hypothetical protein